MPDQIENDLKTIVSTLQKYNEIESIYLFGSYAYGSPTEHSDLDIAILSRDRNTRILDLMSRYGWELLDIVQTPMDLLVYYPEDFFAKAQIEVTMESEILKNGVRIYG